MEINILPMPELSAPVVTPDGVAALIPAAVEGEGSEFVALFEKALVGMETVPAGTETLPQNGQAPAAATLRNEVTPDAVAMMVLLGNQGPETAVVLPSTETLSQNAPAPSILPVRGENPATVEKELFNEEIESEKDEMAPEAASTTPMIVAALVTTAPVQTLPQESALEGAENIQNIEISVVANNDSRQMKAVVEQMPAVSVPETAVQNAQQNAVQAMNRQEPGGVRPVAAESLTAVTEANKMAAITATTVSETGLKEIAPKLQPDQAARGAQPVDYAAGKGALLPAAQMEVSDNKEPTKSAGFFRRDVAMEVSIAAPVVQGDVSADTGESLTGSGHEQAATTAVVTAQHPVHNSKSVEQAGVVTQPAQIVNHESVIEQVKDRLTSHEVRTEGNQVRLQLNPADLGELQITIRMDDQKVRVEILAENKAVKSALLEHMDTLKDVLARQNITVERVDVGTAGQQGFGKFFREGSRPEDQPRAYGRLAQDGGFRQEMPNGRTMAAWQPRSNALVDVRF